MTIGPPISWVHWWSCLIVIIMEKPGRIIVRLPMINSNLALEEPRTVHDFRVFLGMILNFEMAGNYWYTPVMCHNL